MDKRSDNIDDRQGVPRCTARISIGFFAFVGLVSIAAMIYLLLAGR